jgi:hypothetical protein
MLVGGLVVIMRYIAEIESRVAGIPCLIGVSQFDCVRGSYSYNATSDMDYYGYSESEWDVLDRRGRPAAWLERKLTDDDRQRIEQEIAEAMTEEAY